MPRRLRLGLPLAALSALLVVVSAGASSSPDRVSASATAKASAVSIAAPGAAPITAAAVAAPERNAPRAPYAYPADGSIVSASTTSGTATARWAVQATGKAAADLTTVSLFGGEITADTVAAHVSATAASADATGDYTGTKVLGLKVLGADVAATPGTQVPLADWGTLTVLDQTGQPSETNGAPGFHVAVTALHIHLLLDHGGLPAGTDLDVGSADAAVQAATPVAATPAAPVTTTDTALDTTSTTTTTAAKDKGPKRGPGLSLAPPRRAPSTVHPPLTAGGYVFPVYGPSSFVDTFGAARADVNWHHGDDIFAPLGAPILAVADGTLFSVGWNNIGGLRVWLRDGAGNEFYFAHLSALSTQAANGVPVQAGDVIGFVGNTGDAQGTPYHLHFEIHPVSMLYLGYDGAVDPTKYLQAWAKLKDVPITGVVGWAPPLGGRAPKAGAILLQSSDISTASGLDPASLRRAVMPAAGSELPGAGGARDTRVRVPARPLDRG